MHEDTSTAKRSLLDKELLGRQRDRTLSLCMQLYTYLYGRDVEGNC